MRMKAVAGIFYQAKHCPLPQPYLNVHLCHKCQCPVLCHGLSPLGAGFAALQARGERETHPEGQHLPQSAGPTAHTAARLHTARGWPAPLPGEARGCRITLCTGAETLFSDSQSTLGDTLSSHWPQSCVCDVGPPVLQPAVQKPSWYRTRCTWLLLPLFFWKLC